MCMLKHLKSGLSSTDTMTKDSLQIITNYAYLLINKKLSYRRQTARYFMPLNISLSYSRSLKVIENGSSRKSRYGFLFAFHSNYSSVLYHFRDNARYWPTMAIFWCPSPAFDAPLTGLIEILPYRLVWKNWNGVATQCWKSLVIYLSALTAYRRVTDRRTDRRRNMLRQHSPRCA